MRLSRGVSCIDRSPIAVVRGGVEPPPATYQIAMLPLHHRTVGKVGVEPTVSCSQGTRGAVPLHPDVLCCSLQVDRMGVGPGTAAQPWSLRLDRAVSSSPIDERAARAHREREWVGRRSNPRLRLFRPPLYRLSYRPSVELYFRIPLRTDLNPPTKKARCRRDTGPCFANVVWAESHKRNGSEGVFPASMVSRSRE